jgi:hypothetical protein
MSKERMRLEKYFPLKAPGIPRLSSALGELESGWLAGALLVAASLKAILLAVGVVPFNADEAVVALMARHILHGARPVFFYGQAYMGSLDAFLVALGFRIFGESVWVLRFVQILLFLGTLATTAALGKAALGSRRAGVIAAWLLAIPAVNVTLYTTVSLGGYGEMLLLGNLILLTALRIANQISASRPPANGLWMVFGFLAGLGLWAFGMSLVYSLPATLFLAWRIWKTGPVTDPARLRVPAALRRQPTQRDRVAFWARCGGWVALGALAGASPWWGFALRNGPESLVSELLGGAVAGVDGSSYVVQVARHLFNLLVLGLPAAFGMRPPWEVRLLALPLLPLAFAFWLGAVAFSIQRLFRLARGQELIRRYARQRSVLSGGVSLSLYSQTPPCREVFFPEVTARSQASHWLLAGVPVALFAGFAITPFGIDPSGRYLLPLAVILSLFGAETILYLRSAWGKWAYSLVGLVLAFNAWGTLESALLNPPGLTTQFDAQTRLDHRSDPELIRFLLANGEYTGYTTYWIAYPLSFQSEEELVFVPELPYHLDFRHTRRDNRYEPYARLVSRAGQAAYITANHPALDERLRAGFQAKQVDWREVEIGDYRVFYALSRHVRPEELDLAPNP